MIQFIEKIKAVILKFFLKIWCYRKKKTSKLIADNIEFSFDDPDKEASDKGNSDKENSDKENSDEEHYDEEN